VIPTGCRKYGLPVFIGAEDQGNSLEVAVFDMGFPGDKKKPPAERPVAVDHRAEDGYFLA
jgi:hypothetical protein